MTKSAIMLLLVLGCSALYAVPCLEVRATFSGDPKAVIELSEISPRGEVLPSVPTADKAGICRTVYVPLEGKDKFIPVKLPFTFKGNGKALLEVRGVERQAGKADTPVRMLANGVRINNMVSLTDEGVQWDFKDTCRFDGKSYFSPRAVEGEAEAVFEAYVQTFEVAKTAIVKNIKKPNGK